MVLFFLGLFLVSCGDPDEDLSIQEILRKPENLQEFRYSDFGPALFTYHWLGKPMPFEGVAEVKEDGWPIGNLRVLVTAESYLEPQLLFLEEAGKLDPDLDYRPIWYFQAISMLDEILADGEIPENLKTRPREVRQQIIDKMGDADAVRTRTSKYRDPLEKHVRENKMHPRIRALGEEILSKGLSR